MGKPLGGRGSAPDSALGELNYGAPSDTLAGEAFQFQKGGGPQLVVQSCCIEVALCTMFCPSVRLSVRLSARLLFRLSSLRAYRRQLQR